MRRAALLRGLAMALAVLATASFAWAGRSVDPATVAYAFGPDYAGDVLTPSADAAIGRPYNLRDYRGVAVRWNPFRYNPATGTLRVHGETTIEIATAGISARNVLERGRIASRPVRAFADLYRDHFMNYSERQAFAPSSRIDEEGEMLVICHDAWVANLAPLVTHKWGRGITTTVIPVSEIGNDAVSIKNYIRNYYATHNLAFVLLVGDSAQVATPLLNGYDAADPTYAKLSGADDYPDVLVGRMSAQTVAQVDTQIARTIDYENLPANGQDWYRRGVGIASSKGGAGTGDDGQSDREHEDEIRGWLLGAGWTLVDQIYDPGATDRMVESALNTGRGIVNYTGHGNERGWDTSGFNTADVDALVNKDQLPFIVSVGCNNGEFNHFDPCFAEAWLRGEERAAPSRRRAGTTP